MLSLTNVCLSKYLSEWNTRIPYIMKLLKWAYRNVCRTREINRLLEPSIAPQAYANLFHGDWKMTCMNMYAYVFVYATSPII
jgi:hypothetical protein